MKPSFPKVTLFLLMGVFLYFFNISLNGQNFVINGDAIAQGDNCFLLTPASTGQAGSIWLQERTSLDFDFEVNANLNFGTNNTNGADGIAFVFQPICTGLGGQGGGLGYQDIVPSLAIEFDTWQNGGRNDPSQDHIALQKNGNPSHGTTDELVAPISVGNIEDGQDHSVRIKWTANTQTLELTFDGNLLFTYTDDVVANIFGDNPEVFWGFTAATGAAVNNQQVCIDDFTATELIPWTVTPPTCPNTADGIIDFNLTGGIGPFTFLWSTGATTEDLINVTPGTYTVAVSDANDCVSTFVIELESTPDMSIPDLVCPASFSVDNDPGACGAIIPEPTITASDNCPDVAIAQIAGPTLGGTFPVGVSIVTYQATDVSGNTAECSFEVTVNDTEAPMISCLGDVVLDSDPGLCGAMPDINAVTFQFDNCPGLVIVQTEGPTPGSLFPLGTSTLSYTATDASGNEASCSTQVTINDTEFPALTCPADTVIVNDPGDCSAVFNYDLPTATDNCPDVVTTQTAGLGSGATFPLLETVETYEAIDATGNTVTCSFMITVIDHEEPVVNCPPEEVFLTCTDSTDPAITGVPTATDNCELADIFILSQEDFPSFNCEDQLNFRTWGITDGFGNTVICSQTITRVRDTIPPTCENCPEDITVDCDNIPAFAELMLTDNCDTTPEYTVSELSTQTSDGSCSDFDYTITRTYTLLDSCDNSIDFVQQITVIDTLAPVLTCPADTIVSCDQFDDLEATGMAIAVDACDPNPTLTFQDTVVAGDCNWECTVIRTWTAVDACGNETSCEQTIINSSRFLLERALCADIDGDSIPDPIVLGYSRHTLTIDKANSACIIDLLPAKDTLPFRLERGNYDVDSLCVPGANPVDSLGKTVNPLLEAVLIMEINIRLNPALGETPLTEIDCELDPFLRQWLRPSSCPKVKDLLRLGNIGLGNLTGPPVLDEIMEALRCINGTYDKCNPPMDSSALTLSPRTNLFEESTRNEALKVFPNPSQGQIFVDLSDLERENGILRVYNLRGQVLEAIQLNQVKTDLLPINLANQNNGTYLISVQTKNGTLLTQKVVVESSK